MNKDTSSIANHFQIPSARWNGWVRLFHWTSVLFLVVIWAMHALHEYTDDDSNLFISLHKAFGITFFVWILLRVLTRIVTRKNAPIPVEMPRLQTIISNLVHLGLYVCMLYMPITGFLNQQFKDHATNLFGMFTIPVFLTPNPDTADLFEEIHGDFFWMALLLLVGAHALAAIYHQWIKKDRLINRML